MTVYEASENALSLKYYVLRDTTLFLAKNMKICICLSRDCFYFVPAFLIGAFLLPFV